jgi:hypothetical protein
MMRPVRSATNSRFVSPGGGRQHDWLIDAQFGECIREAVANNRELRGHPQGRVRHSHWNGRWQRQDGDHQEKKDSGCRIENGATFPRGAWLKEEKEAGERSVRCTPDAKILGTRLEFG